MRFTAEDQGVVYKFYVQAYAKRGSPSWREQESECEALVAEPWLA
jgi:hypothetical protein